MENYKEDHVLSFTSFQLREEIYSNPEVLISEDILDEELEVLDEELEVLDEELEVLDEELEVLDEELEVLDEELILEISDAAWNKLTNVQKLAYNSKVDAKNVKIIKRIDTGRRLVVPVLVVAAIGTLLVLLTKAIQKQIRIRQLIKRETDGAKRKKLKAELKKESQREIKIRAQIASKKKKAEIKAETSKLDVDPKKIAKAQKQLKKLNAEVAKLTRIRKQIKITREIKNK
jgi:cell division protein FtsB